MRNNIKNILKLIAILIIVVASLVFTYLSLETVNIDGEEYIYCRKVEFWCYKPYETLAIYYFPDKEKYEVEWVFRVNDVDVKDGKFKKEGFEYKTNASDGHYSKLSGYEYRDPESDEAWLMLPDDKHKLVGAVR